MRIEELGERGLIKQIIKKFLVDKTIVTAGAGDDDCAVIAIDNVQKGYKYLVVTTDSLQQSTHFPPGITPFQMGWSAVAVNLSDIAAMGAHPALFVIALGIPAQTEASLVDELAAGIEACASTYNTAVVGGDLTKSNELILTGTCLGFTNNPIRRSGAKVGDLICVTGSLGNAALALQVIKDKLTVSKRIEEEVKKALFQPQPRIHEGLEIANSGVATAMIDISDGLALSIADIAEKSNVGAELYEENLPVLDKKIRRDGRLNLSTKEQRDLALYYGGDYELLFTINPKVLEDEELLQKLRKEVNMSIIGKIVPSIDGIYFKKDATEEKIQIKGYQHF